MHDYWWKYKIDRCVIEGSLIIWMKMKNCEHYDSADPAERNLH